MICAKRILGWTALATAIVVVGCQAPPSHPPQTMAELGWWRERRSQEFTLRMIALHNANRVLSPSVSARDRTASLEVLEGMNADEPEIMPALATALSEPDSPQQVRLAVLGYLAQRGYPGLAEHVVAALPHAKDPKVRAAVLDWIEQHPTPEVLAEVVKLWAGEGETSVDAETRYRRVVAKLGRGKWDDALLGALNTPEFFARGSAIEVLASRIDEQDLRKRLAAIKPKTQAVQAMQYFIESFGCVPKTREELLGAVIAYTGRPIRLAKAAVLATKWQGEHGYRFNIRDLHLLNNLAGDPLRDELSRRQLRLELTRAITARRNLRPDGYGGIAGGRRKFRRGRLVDFEGQAESLSMADLWNLRLINEMIDRRRFKLAIKIIVTRDRQDRQTQWAGLISYEHGKCEAKLYRSAENRGDSTYVPGDRMSHDMADCLSYFVCHFSRSITDPADVGPSDNELAFSKRRNLYGLLLTSLEEGWVNAAYFNPAGIVIDLGDFPLAK